MKSLTGMTFCITGTLSKNFCQAHRAGWWHVQKRHVQHGDFPYCRSRCSHPAHREVGQGGQTLPAHIDGKRVSNDAFK